MSYEKIKMEEIYPPFLFLIVQDKLGLIYSTNFDKKLIYIIQI